MLWYIILGAVGAPLTLVLHELAHCIVVWAHGCTVTVFKPYPHKTDTGWYFGRMRYDKCKRWPLVGRWMPGAPMIKALPLLALWLVLGLVVWLPLLSLAFWESTDVINWLQGWIRNSKNDGGKFRRAGAG